jgi:hypothetical protein
MAAHRLSLLQRRILVWLLAEDQRTRGTMRASHQDLARALGHDKGNLSTSLKGAGGEGAGDHHPEPRWPGRSRGPDPRGEKSGRRADGQL